MPLTFEHKEILRDIRSKIEEARAEQYIVPKIVDEILNEVEKEYEAL